MSPDWRLRTPASRHEDFSVTLHHDHLCRQDGVWIGVLGTADCDLGAVGEQAVARFHHAMTGLLNGLTSPIQLLMVARQWETEALPASDLAVEDSVQTAMARHAQTHLTVHAPLRRRVFLVVSGNDSAHLEHAIGTVARLLAGAGLGTWRLLGTDLYDLFAELEEPWHESITEVTTPLGVARGTSLIRLPGGAVDARWLLPLVMLPLAGDVAIHLRPVAQADALRTLRRRLRDHSAQQLVDLDAGRVDDVKVDVAIDNVSTLQQRLASNASRSIELAVTAVARSADRKRLDTATAQLLSAWALTSAHAVPTHFQHSDTLLSVLPLALNPAGQWKLSDTLAAATALPWGQVEVNDAGGYRLGHTRHGQTPVCLDPFASDVATNANVAVVATSGHGKSFTLSTLVIEATRCGRDVVVIDPEGEYRALIERLGGRYLDLGSGGVSSLNILETGLSAAETVAATGEMVDLICGGLDPGDRSAVEKAALTSLAQATPGRPAVLADLMPRLAETSPRVARILERYSTGPLGELLSRPTTIDLATTGVCGIGFRDVAHEIVPTITLVVAQWLWTQIRRERRRRHIVVDEVGLVLEHAALRRLIVQLARRCRKYDASLIVATQNAGDLLAADDLTVVATNAATVLLGGQRPIDIARMASAFGLTSDQARFLEAAQRGDFLLLSGSRRAEVMIDVPELYAQMMSGAAPPGPTDR